MHRVHRLKGGAVHHHHARPIGQQVHAAGKGFRHPQPRPAESFGQTRSTGVFVDVTGVELGDDHLCDPGLFQRIDIALCQHPALAQPSGRDRHGMGQRRAEGIAQGNRAEPHDRRRLWII